MNRIRITLAGGCFRLARRVFQLGRSLDGLGFKLVPPDPVTVTLRCDVSDALAGIEAVRSNLDRRGGTGQR